MTREERAIKVLINVQSQFQASLDEVDVDEDCKEAEEDNKEIVNALEMAIKALEQEPKTGDWISVNERLPENTQPVLMTIRRMSKLYNHEPFITVGYISWNQTTWWSAHDGDCVRNEIEVLAWMPLPEPYKAESEDKK